MASGLSIVVDTRNAEQSIKNLNQLLQTLESTGNSVSNMMRGLGNGSFGNIASSANSAKISSKDLGDALVYTKVSLQNATSATSLFQSAVQKLSGSLNTAQSALARFNQSGQSIVGVFSAINGANGSNGVNSLNTAIATLTPNVTALNNQLRPTNQALSTFATNANKAEVSATRLNTALINARTNMTGFASSTNGVGTSLGRLHTTMTGLQGQISGMGASLSALNNNIQGLINLNNQINNLQNNAGRARNAYEQLNSTLGKLQALATGGVLGGMVLSVLKTADAMQNLDNQVRIVTKSTEERLAVEQRVFEIANKNYTSLQTTTDIYHRNALAMAAMGASQNDVLRFTDNMSLAMRTSGRSITEQNSALYQWSQAMGAGKLQGQEFKVIALAVPSLLKYIAAEMGTTQGHLKKLGSEGKITAETMVKALERSRPELERLASQMPMTMTQSLSIFKNKYDKFIDGIMNGTGGASQKIAGFIQVVGNNFDNISKVAIAGAGLAFIQFASKVDVGAKAMALFNLVMKANPLILVATAVIGVATAFYGLDDVMKTSGIIFGDLYDVISTGLKGLSDLSGAVAFNISQSINESNQQNNQSYTGFFDNTQKGFAGLLQGIGRVLAAATSTLAGFFAWMGNGFWNALKVAGNAFIWLGNQAKLIVNSIGEAMVGMLNTAINSINGLLNGANSILENMPMTMRFNAIGNLKWNGSHVAPTSYNEISGKTLQENIGDYMQPLMGGVDSYFKSVDDRTSAVKENTKAVKSMSDRMNPDLYKQNLAQQAKDKAEADEKEAKKQAKNGNQYAPLPVNQTVLSHASKYGYADLEKRYGLPSGLLSALSMQESRGNPNATSPVGAKGEFQFMPATARRFGIGGQERNTQLAAEAAAKYLSQNMKMFGNLNSTIASYNAGEGNVKKYGGIPPFKETQNYVKLVRGYLSFMNGGKDGGYSPNKLLGLQESAETKQENLFKKQQEEALKLKQDYGTKEVQLAAQLKEKIDKINANTQLSTAEKEQMVKQAEENGRRELAEYQKGLDDKLQALGQYKASELSIINKSRTDAYFQAEGDFKNDPNGLKLAKAEIDEKWRYDINQYQVKMQKQRSELFAFQKTERQVMVDGWANKIADAELATDELKDIRLEALRTESEQAIAIFDLEQSQKLLDLKKFTTTDMQYFEQALKIKQDLVDKSNLSPEMKSATKAGNEYENRKSILGIFKNQPENLDIPMFFGKGAKGQFEEAIFNNAEIQRIYNEGYAALEASGQLHSQKTTDFQRAYQEAIRVSNEEIMQSERGIFEERMGMYDQLLGMAGGVWDTMTDMVKKSFGEQSAAARGFFFVQKSIAIAQAMINTEQAATKALADGGAVMGIPMATMVRGLGYTSIGLMASQALAGLAGKGFATGGYTGNGGISDVAGVVHGKEYVVNAANTARYRNKLEAMNAGTYNDGGNNISVNVSVNSDGSGSVESNAQIGKNLGNVISMAVQKELIKQKRQGGALYGR